MQLAIAEMEAPFTHLEPTYGCSWGIKSIDCIICKFAGLAERGHERLIASKNARTEPGAEGMHTTAASLHDMQNWSYRKGHWRITLGLPGKTWG